jgi:starch phosphorylase
MYRNPVQLLINVPPRRWETLLDTEVFAASYASVIGALDRYVAADHAWFARAHADYQGGPVAYASMEYGLHACLPIYAGGLGILSGDHLKTASDLGVPLVGLGLLYRHGYFRQTVDADGLQQHSYLEYDFDRLPVRPVAAAGGGRLLVEVPFPGRDVAVAVWLAEVGRVPLLLLSTDVERNHPADRAITSVLYVRSREMRLAQELVLGVAAVRALEALGIAPAVWHVNEGHSAFIQVERLRRHTADRGAPLADAVSAVRANTLFTTHTPVPAGHERFDAALATRYLAPLAEPVGISVDELRALGRDDGDGADAPLNLTALGLRASAWANAVSRLNAEVCDAMWRHVAPARANGPAIHPITNGVHNATWCGPALRDLLARHVAPDWPDRLLEPDVWNRVYDIPDHELWAAHLAQKERLVRFARGRLLEQFGRHGRSPDELRALDRWFDPQALIIGFARRFATYKRVWLVFSDLERFRALLGDPARPVQLLFAGKAHPADRPGQDLIRHIAQLAHEEGVRGRIGFLEDYDMRVGAMLVQGTDAWLNTPRRPHEASGTSGQKAALNGGLNVSILDGWWPEAFDGQNGWAIEGEAGRDDAERDRHDAAALYRVLGDAVIPTYYDRDDAGLPRRWLAMMKRAIATVSPGFSSARMVRDYVEQAYVPLAGRR